MTGIRIAGTGRYVPPLTADNNDFAAFLDTNDEWIRSRTGIVTRHISDGEPSWHMGLEASRQALEAAGIAPEQLGLIIDTTITPDYSTPATACVIQRELGAVNAMAFDVNSACTGFVCGLDMAARYLATDPALSYVLVVSNENLSRVVDYTDRSSCILFGDGAGACVLKRRQGLYSAYMAADGTGASSLYANGNRRTCRFATGEHTYPEDTDPRGDFLRQDGKVVYRFATEAMPRAVQQVLDQAGLGTEDIDLLIPHQANLRIIETAAKKLKFPMDKIMVNLEKYGNTSSASIPIALDEAVRSGRLRRGQRVCLVGFGAGLTLGAVLFEY